MAAAAETIGFFTRRDLKTAHWSRRIASFSAILFITACIGHRYGFMETAGLLPVFGVVAGLAALALLLALYAFSRLWRFGDLGGGDILRGILVSVLVLTPFAVAGYKFATLPMLTDISTDVEDPPMLKLAASMRTPEMNVLGSYTSEAGKVQLDAYPQVTGRRYDLPFELTQKAVDKVLKERGWRILVRKFSDDDVELTLEGRARTFVLRLPVDFAVRLTDEDTTTYVDMRSASRFGEHDFGDNAARISAFLADVDTEVTALRGLPPPPAPPSADGAGERPAPADGLPHPSPRPEPLQLQGTE